ncbi:hypothetical protein [Robiginitalea biformata]|nr:hypothetical protein [Robiginitalea sp. PM2]MDC6376056.1 hypothetical protein [Robiginitalea sp. SP8]
MPRSLSGKTIVESMKSFVESMKSFEGSMNSKAPTTQGTGEF